MKLSPAYIASQVETCAFAYDGTFTVCTITTHSGFMLAGTSRCLDPANYDRAAGEEVAHKNAIDQLWALEGYFFSKLGMQKWATPEQGVMILETLLREFNAGSLVSKPKAQRSVLHRDAHRLAEEIRKANVSLAGGKAGDFDIGYGQNRDYRMPGEVL